MEIRRTLITGSLWTVFSNIGANLITLGVTIALARLLTPGDFGVIAISSVFVGVISLFQDLGMGSAIIHRKDIDDDYLSTSFTASVAAGAILALALASISPCIARFYGETVLKRLLMASSLGFILTPFVSIHTTLLAKRLEFGKIAFINLLTQALSGAISISFAALGYGPWSLVLGRILAQPILIPVVWKAAGWRPRPVFVKRCFLDLFGFSSSLLGFNLLNYFARNTDNLIIGKYLGPVPLGYYTIAYNFMLKPLELVSWSIGRVLFPVFSSIQDDRDRTRSVYLKIVRSISLVTFPMMTGLIMVAEEFILAVYGERWRGVIVPLRLLCVAGAVQSIGTTGGVILNSSGRPDLTFKLGGTTAVLSVISFFVGIRWGLNGLVIAYLCVSIPGFFVSQTFINRVTGLRMPGFIASMTPAAACSALMVAVLAALKYVNVRSLHLEIEYSLALFVLLGAASYALFVLTLFRVPEVAEAFDIVKRRLQG